MTVFSFSLTVSSLTERIAFSRASGMVERNSFFRENAIVPEAFFLVL